MQAGSYRSIALERLANHENPGLGKEVQMEKFFIIYRKEGGFHTLLTCSLIRATELKEARVEVLEADEHFDGIG